MIKLVRSNCRVCQNCRNPTTGIGYTNSRMDYVRPIPWVKWISWSHTLLLDMLLVVQLYSCIDMGSKLSVRFIFNLLIKLFSILNNSSGVLLVGNKISLKLLTYHRKIRHKQLWKIFYLLPHGVVTKITSIQVTVNHLFDG